MLHCKYNLQLYYLVYLVPLHTLIQKEKNHHCRRKHLIVFAFTFKSCLIRIFIIGIMDDILKLPALILLDFYNVILYHKKPPSNLFKHIAFNQSMCFTPLITHVFSSYYSPIIRFAYDDQYCAALYASSDSAGTYILQSDEMLENVLLAMVGGVTGSR